MIVNLEQFIFKHQGEERLFQTDTSEG